MKRIITIGLAFFTLIACERSLEPIRYGQDDCHWCQMRIMDPKFGAEAITEKGRVYKFDSGECLLNYLGESPHAHSHLAVTDFEHAETLMNAESSWFLISEQMPSPMGAYLNAFQTQDIALKYQDQFGGDILNWTELKSRFQVVK